MNNIWQNAGCAVVAGLCRMHRVLWEQKQHIAAELHAAAKAAQAVLAL
jgi:hypothetical protein